MDRFYYQGGPRGLDDMDQRTSSEHTGSGSMATPLLMSTMAGASTTLGALIVLLMKGVPGPDHLAFALSLAGGVMLSVSVMELWYPQLASADMHKLLRCCLSTSFGAGAFLLLSRFIIEPEIADLARDVDLELAGQQQQHNEKIKDRGAKQRRLAIVMSLTLTAHNFPEGIAVAVSSLESHHLGIVVMTAIAVHNIPEGIAIAVPVLDATQTHWKAILMASLSGIAEPVGALSALTFLPRSLTTGDAMEDLLSFVGGVMSAVALTELLPEAHEQNRPKAMCAGLLTGVIIMVLTIELVPG